MRERPILFNGAMVRAILAGQKTQTRRAVAGVRGDNCLSLRKPTKIRSGIVTHVLDAPEHGLCPFGQPGERLWVRETWQGPLVSEEEMDADGYWATNIATYQNTSHCIYAADGRGAPDWVDADGNLHSGWRPSIHMPRWACRLVLEITAVRVERLQSISDADALAEGIEELNGRYTHNGGSCECRTPGGAFHELWTSTGGDWDRTPGCGSSSST